MPALWMKQPNGRYARWSSVVDDFTHFNYTRNEALEECRHELGAMEATAKMERADRDEARKRTKVDGLNRWREALETMRALGKTKEADKAEATDREEPTLEAVEEPPLVLGKVAIMFSAPQTLLCTADGVGLATVHGKDREERERVARWLAERINREG